MKPLKVLCLALFCVIQTALLTYSQTDTGATADSSNTGVQEDVISDNPTSDEISSLFKLATNGERDPFRIVALVASKKDNSVPGLEGFLFQSAQTTKDTNNTAKKEANKQYAVYALNAISTVKAEKLLMRAAQSHPDIEIRGLALKMLAGDVYYRLKNNTSTALKPYKELVHLLVQNADDTTYVESCNETIGKITREGINNWTGEDYGDMPTGQRRENISNVQGMNMKNYREQWWQNNNSSMKWNNNTGHFEMK